MKTVRLSGIVALMTVSAIWPAHATDPGERAALTQISVIVGDVGLSATLDDTTAGRDFAAMLPLDLTLSDHHGIEKIADLPHKFDTSDAPASYKPQTVTSRSMPHGAISRSSSNPSSPPAGWCGWGEFDGPIDALARKGDVPVRIERAD